MPTDDNLFSFSSSSTDYDKGGKGHPQKRQRDAMSDSIVTSRDGGTISGSADHESPSHIMSDHEDGGDQKSTWDDMRHVAKKHAGETILWGGTGIIDGGIGSVGQRLHEDSDKKDGKQQWPDNWRNFDKEGDADSGMQSGVECHTWDEEMQARLSELRAKCQGDQKFAEKAYEAVKAATDDVLAGARANYSWALAMLRGDTEWVQNKTVDIAKTLMSRYHIMDVGEYQRAKVLWAVTMLGGWRQMKQLLNDHEKPEDRVRLLGRVQAMISYDGSKSWSGSNWRDKEENRCQRSFQLWMELLALEPLGAE